ncbi:MAG: lysophospholipid acyltransferase family protein [Parabacteroides sp.]|nr:lysophospholipid acyltransferase family protein [Parabacteroides sp.]
MTYVRWRVLYAFSDLLFGLLYYIVRYRRSIVRRNLTESFPEKSPAEIRRIEKAFYHFFADLILESGKLAFITPDEISRRMRFTNVESINSSLRQGKPVAIYLGHYANWEWVSSMPLWLEKGTIGAQIYHELRSKRMDRLMLHIRGRMGAVCVEMRKTARYINEWAQNREACAIGFIADQSPKKREVRHFLSFLNHEVPVLTGTEKVIKRYGFEAWYLDVRRVKRGFYEAEFVRLHEMPRELSDFELTALYFQRLEQTIRRQPELYLWTHNRFKHAKKA